MQDDIYSLISQKTYYIDIYSPALVLGGTYISVIKLQTDTYHFHVGQW